MKDHPFLFTPKNWLGEGTINLSMSDEELSFFTRWSMGDIDDIGEIEASQEVQIKGMTEVMHNQFRISEITNTTFIIELENASIGLVEGKGIIKDDLIAWEFNQPDLGFEGFEFYEKQDDDTYHMRAEYSTPDQHRTIIKGRIWEKQQAPK